MNACRTSSCNSKDFLIWMPRIMQLLISHGLRCSYLSSSPIQAQRSSGKPISSGLDLVPLRYGALCRTLPMYVSSDNIWVIVDDRIAVLCPLIDTLVLVGVQWYIEFILETSNWANDESVKFFGYGLFLKKDGTSGLGLENNRARPDMILPCRSLAFRFFDSSNFDISNTVTVAIWRSRSIRNLAVQPNTGLIESGWKWMNMNR